MLTDILHFDSLVVFVLTAIAIIPIAKLIGDSTEALAHYYSTGVSAVLNSTCGNLVEIVLAVFAIKAGLIDLVKASITGSILGNILLISGLSLIAGGFPRKELTFRKSTIEIQTSMLMIALAGLLTPTIFSLTTNRSPVILSDFVALIMILVYIIGIIFSFRYNKHIITSEARPVDVVSPNGWSKRTSIAVLGCSTIAAAFLSEILIRSVEHVGKNFQLSELFIGVVVVAVIGNAAEHSSAITLARKGKVDLSLEITSASSIQIALFAVPILVLAGLIMDTPVTLVFTLFEVVAVFLAVLLAHFVASDGSTNWLEGLQLLSLYMIIAATFFFM